MQKHPSFTAVVFVCLATQAAFVSAAPLPTATPQQVGMRSGIGELIDKQVAQALEDKKMPGCVVLVGRHGKVVHRRAYGNRRLEPSIEPMTVDTVFDLASLTKPIATSTSILQLVERGELRLRDKVSDYFPEFAAHEKKDITVEQLLVHSAGLIPDNPVGDYTDGWSGAYKMICDLELRSEPGEKFKYSDVGFILLGELVKQRTGQPLDEYAKEHVFAPLGMTETMYNPPPELCERAATTEQVDGEWLRGIVHDPRARLLDGVAGHAGLFSTADDLSIYAQALLQRGKRGDRQILSPRLILSPRSFAEWTRARTIDGNLRGLGWDMGSVYSRNRGEMMSPRAFGHGGFTGTAMWIDPELDLFVIFLSNRVHPVGVGEVNNLAGRIGTIASAACSINRASGARKGRGFSNRNTASRERPTRRLTPTARLGVDVLAEDQFAILRGKRVGLIANHTSQNAAGVPTAKLLADAPGVELVALFSPEHGIAGTADQPNIDDAVDATTGLPVFSLYGETRRPMPAHLEQIDVMVFDIQDIGCRFYTYLSTMGLAMEACSEAGKSFVVLDRPNPIGGLLVEGPMLDAGSESFVGYHSLPVRHGMTVGELAKMFRAERGLELDLTIVELKDWRRGDYLYDTGLPWINTSPNMRSLTQAVLYPGVGLFETTNVSVGRGTDTPFEVFGAPWIDGTRLAASIQRFDPPGVRVVPIRFTPDSSKHKGKECGGVQFVVTDWQRFRPLQLAWAIGASLVEHYPDDWDAERFPRLLGSRTVYEKLLAGASPDDIRASYEGDLRKFRKRREPFLIY